MIYDINGNEVVVDVNVYEPEQDDIPTVTLEVDGGLPQAKSDGEVQAIIHYKSNSMKFSEYATLKVQGDSSTRYPKKNFTVKLFSDSNYQVKDKRVFKDWGKRNKFVLKANWIDHSHARNIVSARLWTQIVKSESGYEQLPNKLKNGHIAVDGFPVKVYANGVYQGLYTWNVPKDALYGLSEDVSTHAFMQGNSTSYSGSILFRAANDNEDKWTDELRDEKTQTIIDSWNRVLNFVYTSSDSTFVSDFSNYFNKETIIDQYIFVYVGCIVDNLAKNQTFFTYDTQMWYGGMYDMDGTWGCPCFPPNKSTWYDYNTAFQSGYTVATDGSGLTNLLYERVGTLFSADIINRYVELRSSVLSKGNIVAEFDRFMGEIPPYLYEEDYAETTAGGDFTEIPLADENNILQIREFVSDRLDYCDSMILS